MTTIDHQQAAIRAGANCFLGNHGMCAGCACDCHEHTDPEPEGTSK